MTIDTLVEELTHISRQRFVAKQDMHDQLRERVYRIGEYDMTANALSGLDALALTLKRQRREDITDIIAPIDAARSPYREQGEHHLFGIMSTNNAQYATRFERIHNLLDTQQSFAYDDLALARDWLQTNPYVKRKRKTNEEFDQAAQELEEDLARRIEKERVFRTPISDPKTYRTMSPSEDSPPTRAYTAPETPVTEAVRASEPATPPQAPPVTYLHDLPEDQLRRLADSMGPPTFTRTQKILGAAGIGVTSVLFALSWLPQHLYAPFYQ